MQHHQYPSLQYQTPPQLPKKTRPKPQNFRPIISGNVIHSGGPSIIDIQHLRNPKRKSAVELLAESKPYYVKSEISPSQITGHWVRRWDNGMIGSGGGGDPSNATNNDLAIFDRKQQVLHQSGRAYSSKKSHSSTLSPTSCLISPSHTFPHQRAHTLNNRRSAPSNSELLQMKLRRLINDSALPKENTFDFYSMTNSNNTNYCRRPSFELEDTKFEPPKQFSTPKCLNQELTINAASDSDTDVMFPSAFLSPQSLPSHNTLCDDDIYTYCDDKNDYQPISPPDGYAEFSSSPIQSTPRNKESRSSNVYQRSYSHSHTAEIEEPDYASPTHTTTNHKSLPDLHTQTNRNSPYSEYSEGRGNRSNKSNSSLNRDSGGSSGHYTHRSEPYCKQEQYNKYQSQSQSQTHTQPHQKPQYNMHQKYYGPDNRRDSGSSTQHSGNSYYNNYSGAASRLDYIVCDDQSPIDENCLLNFTTSVVPEAFQDRFSDEEPNQLAAYDQSHQMIHRTESRSKSYYGNKMSNYEPNSYGSTVINNCGNGECELSPPLGTFKRQKCLRLKQHPSRHPSPSDRPGSNPYDDRIPILRSKSDISHRYSNRNHIQNDHNPSYLNEINFSNGDKHQQQQQQQQQPQQRANVDSLSELERFFDRLGLPDDLYNEYIVNNSSDSSRSSPVFFSDVPTMDSDQLPDSTETQIETQPYRPIEPTSIVERNARIIKWLCTCRKLQVT